MKTYYSQVTAQVQLYAKIFKKMKFKNKVSQMSSITCLKYTKPNTAQLLNKSSPALM